ncbi:hypothetical protein MKW92_031017 [Papaver armeniacum]|nr:hypothetical protein MKW92_031017 [Papaver armeniacum]
MTKISSSIIFRYTDPRLTADSNGSSITWSRCCRWVERSSCEQVIYGSRHRLAARNIT